MRALNPPRLRLAGVRIQIVDDCEINREVAQRLLMDEGAEVRLADDGRQAVDWLKRHPDAVDVVLMDVQMPMLNGYEAAREIRRTSALSAVPIVALTAGAFPEEQALAQAAGMNGFLPKPFDVDAAITVIARLTRQGEREVQAAGPSPARVDAEANSGTDLPGLTVSRGLRTWKDAAAYRQYLRKFVRDYSNIAERISRAPMPEGAALAHRLQGAAGNLALDAVAWNAAQVERSLGTGRDAADCLASLQSALATALESIGQYARIETPVPPSVAASMAPDTMGAMLAELLAACDADSQSQVGAILMKLAEALPSTALEPIRHALEDFDFRGVEAATRALAATFGIPVEVK